MTQLKCSAQTCVYNQENLCCKGDIQIEGKNAGDASGTCCASFRERKGDSILNAMEHPSKNIDVDCEAVRCIFNEDCKCSAKVIGIRGSHACNCDDTECASFECRA